MQTFSTQDIIIKKKNRNQVTFYMNLKWRQTRGYTLQLEVVAGTWEQCGYSKITTDLEES